MSERRRGTEYVMLRLDGLRLLLRQAEVLSLEPAEEADMSTPHPGAVNDYQAHPVFALSEGLDGFLKGSEVRGARPICALLDMPAGNYYGILCNEAALLPASAIDIKSVPTVMREDDSPLLGIALDGAGSLCLSSAAVLWSLIDRLEGIAHGALVHT